MPRRPRRSDDAPLFPGLLTPDELRERLSAAGPRAAMVVLRFAIGIAFLIAGAEKVADPAFIAASGQGSIGQALAGYAASGSPIAPLIVALGQPNPTLVGALMAGGETLIGLALLIGVATRVAAAAAAGVSVLLFFTAGWGVWPPYLSVHFAWFAASVALAIAGDGSLFTIRGLLDPDGAGRDTTPPAPRVRRMEEEIEIDRRNFLGLIGTSATAIIGLAFLMRTRAIADLVANPSTVPAPTPGIGSPSPSPSGSLIDAPVAKGALIPGAKEMVPNSAIDFKGDDGSANLIVRLPDGEYTSFGSTCTHMGCTTGYDAASGLILCPCHGAAFDPKAQAQVVAGPAPRPLPARVIEIDAQGNVIYGGS
jgi:thiosulfate dehydrogenase [quinone] large subunit